MLFISSGEDRMTFHVFLFLFLFLLLLSLVWLGRLYVLHHGLARWRAGALHRNRRWSETWKTATAHQRALRTNGRQAKSHQRLTRALWTFVYRNVRLSQLSHPPVHALPSSAAPARVQQPVRRLGTGYSWRQPFLRRLPSSPAGSGKACAKK